MKITIEPTTKDGGYRTVSVSSPADGITLSDVMDLIEAAVLAWGFHQNTVDEYWGR